MKKNLVQSAVLSALFFGFTPSLAADPHHKGYENPSSMHGLLARVSGSGQRGFKDGRFWEAMFNMPRSLVVDGEGRFLYVVDTGNNRLRRVELLEDGKTETLAGTGEALERDGNFQTAALSRPTLAAFANPETLILYDAGISHPPTRRFRVVDLKKQFVTTLSIGNSESQLGQLSDMTAGLESNQMFFVADDSDSVFSLNTITGEIKTLSLTGDVGFSRPRSVTISGRKMYVLGGAPQRVFEIELANWNFAQNMPVSLRVVTDAADAVSVRATGEDLYLLGKGHNCLSRFSRNVVTQIPMVNAWGQTIACNESLATNMLQGEQGAPSIIVVDPSNRSRIYFVSIDRSSVEVLRNYNQAFLLSEASGPSDWMPDFAYPEKKDPGVYRVLLMGDSRVFHHGMELDPSIKMNKFDTLAKQIEMHLNLTASIRGSKRRFEVLTLAATSGYSMFTWGYYRAPEIVRKYDIDLTIVSMFYPPSLQTLLYRPLPGSRFETPEEPGGDGEYALSSDLEKVQDGPLKLLYDGLVADKLVIERPGGKLEFVPIGAACGSPNAREGLFAAYSQMFSNIVRKVERAKEPKSEQSKMLLLLAPPGLLGLPTCLQELMARMSHDTKVPFLDLAPLFTATGTTFYTAFGRGEDHLTKDGYHLYGDIIADVLFDSEYLN